jgi:hypothetical protein
MKRPGILVLVFALGGCGIAQRLDSRQHYEAARANYETSLAAYRTCVAAGPIGCEGKRLAMEADERAFNAMSGQSASVGVLQR